VHKPLGQVQGADPEKSKEMKTRLSKSNFGMGKANVSYFTTNKVSHSPMKADYFTKDQRKEKADVNHKTNFIS